MSIEKKFIYRWDKSALKAIKKYIQILDILFGLED